MTFHLNATVYISSSNQPECREFLADCWICLFGLVGGLVRVKEF